MLRKWMVGLPRRYKRALQLLVDVLMVWASLWLAFIVRLGVERPVDPFGDYAWLFLIAPVIAIPVLCGSACTEPLCVISVMKRC